jgi:ribulose-5-phosphate 4-epimerase/fuculose-1-phosphate aldolase
MSTLDTARAQLAFANRILAHEGVLEAFGHVSIRHPSDAGRYLLARSRSPELIQPEDILEFTLDSQPVVPATTMLYGERVIHGCIYAARPDVNAVCHHHSRSVMPFCISGIPLQPVDHLGATMGTTIPFWDQAEEFGVTDLIVAKPEEGQSLARALGRNWVVLMRRHGGTVAGTTLQEMVFRSIFSCRNAELQRQAQALGPVERMLDAEVDKAGAFNLEPRPIARAWEYWMMRLEKSGNAAFETAKQYA